MKHTQYFCCVGAQKSGTTTLHNILATHPEIALPAVKETKFFSDDKLYSKGIDFYHSEFFKLLESTQYSGEIDPDYLFFTHCAERIFNYRSDSKILILLRNPIERAYSHYLMSVRYGLEKHSFQRALDIEKQRISESVWNADHYSYFSRSCYYEQIARYLSFFPENQIHFVLLENLHNNLDGEISKITNFLNLNSDGFEYTNRRGKSGATPKNHMLSKILHNPNTLRKVTKRYASPDGIIAKSVRYLRNCNEKPLDNTKKRQDIRTLNSMTLAKFDKEVAKMSDIIDLDLTIWEKS